MPRIKRRFARIEPRREAWTIRISSYEHQVSEWCFLVDQGPVVFPYLYQGDTLFQQEKNDGQQGEEQGNPDRQKAASSHAIGRTRID